MPRHLVPLPSRPSLAGCHGAGWFRVFPAQSGIHTCQARCLQPTETKKEIAFCDDDCRELKERKMMRILDVILGRRRLILTETQRAVLLRKGKLSDILVPGNTGFRAEMSSCRCMI